MSTKKPERIEVNIAELQATLEQIRSIVSERQHDVLAAAVETLGWLTATLQQKNASIARLRKLMFGPTTEKTKTVVAPRQPDAAAEEKGPDGEVSGDSAGAGAGGRDEEEPKKKRKKGKAHGRNAASAYDGAAKVCVPHESLQPGEVCPKCGKGKVYLHPPALVVCVTGQAPLPATLFELGQLRCSFCGIVFTAKAPEAANKGKYDERAAAMNGLLKYGTGTPFSRLEALQRSLGIPLPAATQWDIVSGAADKMEPAFEELKRQAAQGEVVHNDDTPVIILELLGVKRQNAASDDESATESDAKERTGLFTTSIVSILGAIRIALFFSGRKHAGENMRTVLRKREPELPPPIQMCDMLSRNLPKDFATILSACIAHSRRKFVDVADAFPDECLFVLETLAEVYRIDARSREQGLSPDERLRLHQDESSPLMKKLQDWMEVQLDEKLIEPNSTLGGAMKYMRKHWEKLTLFLRKPGAPLDNNICERALKKAILQRKNSYFFKTQNGARVSDIFMSLIHTAELAKVNPFEYLVALQEHAKELREKPEQWMPWNYQATLAANTAVVLEKAS
ncbi:MAG: IS66 family transposase [Vicinamibacteria bacterium]